mgnify:CR=1 FL=1
MVKVGIVGGTGYTGVELLRLLAQHPQAEVVAITSRSEAGLPVADLYPNLRGHYDGLAFSVPDVKVLGACDVVFFATPHGVAHALAGELLAAGTKVIDLSADFRLQDADEWAKWYNQPHGAPQLLPEAVYGLPEVNREKIKSARLIAVPGCYPTATQLGFLPLLEAGLADPMRLIADCKSGISGAGRGASVGSLYAETSESFKAYAVKGHRHLPEISQGLRRAAGGDVGLTFVPHLTPMIRGIHATLYSTVVDKSVDLQALFGGKDVWLEVGFGGGDHLVHQAAANPDVGIIGAEPFINGVAMLLGKIRRAGVKNLAVYPGDARDLMDVLLEASVSRALLLYPDPWPKARHHRRRFLFQRFRRLGQNIFSCTA